MLACPIYVPVEDAATVVTRRLVRIASWLLTYLRLRRLEVMRRRCDCPIPNNVHGHGRHVLCKPEVTVSRNRAIFFSLMAFPIVAFLCIRGLMQCPFLPNVSTLHPALMTLFIQIKHRHSTPCA